MPKEEPVSGSKIRQFRERKHLLQHDLASNLRKRGFGTTQAQVSRWEAGQEPRSYVLRALAEELGVSIDELYGDDADEEAAQMPVRRDRVQIYDVLIEVVTEARERERERSHA